MRDDVRSCHSHCCLERTALRALHVHMQHHSQIYVCAALPDLPFLTVPLSTVKKGNAPICGSLWGRGGGPNRVPPSLEAGRLSRGCNFQISPPRSQRLPQIGVFRAGRTLPQPAPIGRNAQIGGSLSGLGRQPKPSGSLTGGWAALPGGRGSAPTASTVEATANRRIPRRPRPATTGAHRPKRANRR